MAGPVYGMDMAAFDLPLDIVASSPLAPTNIGESSTIKEARSIRLEHRMPSGDLARIYRNVQMTLVRVNRPERPHFSYHLHFEVYCDGWCTHGYNTGVDFQIRRDDVVLQSIPEGRLEVMRNPRTWYSIDREGRLDSDAFEASKTFRFISNEDRMVKC